MFKRPSFSSAVTYRDPEAAMLFLQAAFGFEPAMIIRGPDGLMAHTEMTFGDGLIMVSSEWNDAHRSPASLDARNTQSVHVFLNEDVDAHCARARAAGARIVLEPTDQFYGERTYRACDPEGHIWTFGQTVTSMKAAEWDKAGGVTTWVRPDHGY
jgi:uncharacterized glyoxalase superfamily protein PhnB